MLAWMALLQLTFHILYTHTVLPNNFQPVGLDPFKESNDPFTGMHISYLHYDSQK